jgi:hypothetical protein
MQHKTGDYDRATLLTGTDPRTTRLRSPVPSHDFVSGVNRCKLVGLFDH